MTIVKITAWNEKGSPTGENFFAKCEQPLASARGETIEQAVERVVERLRKTHSRSTMPFELEEDVTWSQVGSGTRTNSAGEETEVQTWEAVGSD